MGWRLTGSTKTRAPNRRWHFCSHRWSCAAPLKVTQPNCRCLPVLQSYLAALSRWMQLNRESWSRATDKGKCMRVAILAPISWRVPPRHYGPWERVVSILTEGLVARGVDVTLFATGDSVTAARLHAVAPHGYSEDPALDVKVYESLHIAAAFERAAEFDVLHNHFDFLPLTYSRLVQTPFVTTVHGFSSERIVPVYRQYNDRVHLVAISDADRHPDLT